MQFVTVPLPGKTMILYVAFAALATLTNIGAQWLVFRVYHGPFSLMAGMVVGTGCGLVLKYGLDKRWIFADRGTGLKQHARKFGLYSLIGLGTTAIFWITEFLFAAIGPQETWRYIGAVAGLAIGYCIKYGMDRRFVFERTA